VGCDALYFDKSVDCVLNVMAHAQKPNFIFRRNGRVHLNQRGASVQSTSGSRVVRISSSNAEYTMFRGSVKGTGYPFHSPVSPPLRHRVPSHFSWTLPPFQTASVAFHMWQGHNLPQLQIPFPRISKLCIINSFSVHCTELLYEILSTL